MEYNPYTPPRAKTDISPSLAVAPRPLGVWLLIACIVGFALIFAAATVQFLGAVFSRWDEVRSIALLAVSLVWRLALIAIFLAAAYALYCRRGWARWFGVALIVLFAALSIFGPDTTSYANAAERAGGQMGRLVIFPFLLAWWAYAFSFSSKARRYFSRTSSDAVRAPDTGR